MHKFTNRLIESASPYLLQHAHNPVDWFEWGVEALDKAKREDKPILVSIGYSSCHWCHVMERESFEDETIAGTMNELFVCIKVDREERPDIDAIYMDAVQALGVNGGWPLNVFLTPEQKPFFGGTYFSPPMWTQILRNIHTAFRQNRDTIENSAEELRLHLLRSDVQRFKQPAANLSVREDINTIYKKLQAGFDQLWGGMEKAPKFIMPSVWHWLLRYYHLTNDQSALNQLTLTLRKIAMGGIYDQVGGGFARYSVDGYWFVPHFEKMLYDNAQLVELYSEAYAVTRDEEFKTVVYETFEWLKREMSNEQGGFYSALDADSEGVEGKFYCWTKEELDTILGSDADLISSFYSVSKQGNWEHGMNILILNTLTEQFISEHKLSLKEWALKLSSIKNKLLTRRESRIRPALDDKVITAWNAMMVVGLVRAYAVFSDKQFLDAAIRNIHFIEANLTGEGHFLRSWKNKPSTVPAFLDDYAYLIRAYSELYQSTFEETWIEKANALTKFTLVNFFDEGDGYFHYAGRTSEKLVATKKEIFDNVIPASNSVMARNLLHLGSMLDNKEWKDLGTRMISDLSGIVKAEPNYTSNWAIGLTELEQGLAEVVMIGKDAEAKRREFNTHFSPFSLMLGTITESQLALVADKKSTKTIESPIYICYGNSCKPPVSSVHEALNMLKPTS
jgi:uncharacterized protein YyaL (SSP411 family)